MSNLQYNSMNYAKFIKYAQYSVLQHEICPIYSTTTWNMPDLWNILYWQYYNMTLTDIFWVFVVVLHSHQLYIVLTDCDQLTAHC